MFITLRKKNILFFFIIIMAVGFLFTSLKNIRQETATFNSLLEELAQSSDESKETPGEDLDISDVNPLPVLGNPLEIETQLEIPVRANYFMEYKMERDRIRSRQIDLMREIVNNPNSVTENRMEAQQRLLVISDNLEKELELESLLAAKGFYQTAVLIQPTAVTIVVGKAKLSQEDIAKISDIAVTTTNFSLENIIIIPIQESTD